MKKTKRLLREIKRVLNAIFGSIIDESFWRFRHILDKSWAESYLSENSINHPHRKLLIDKISTYLPFESVLELGCASGANLYILAKKFPEKRFYGIDISKKAIKAGGCFLKKKNIRNIFLKSAKVENLEKYQDKSIDIIFTDAVLIYVGPEKIEYIIKNIIRVAKKAILLCEQHSDSPRSFYEDHWIHNYKLLFNKFIPFERIKLNKIPSSIWGGSWGEVGYIIEVVL